MKKPLYDISLTGNMKTGLWLAHTIHCPEVEIARAAGLPVATMMACQGLPENIELHTCLENAEVALSAVG